MTRSWPPPSRPARNASSIGEALGRVAAEAAVARTSLPPWPNSAMDGYAIQAADTAAAGDAVPSRLDVIGEVRAGVAPDVAVRPGTARPHRDRRAPARRRGCGRPGRSHDAAGRRTAGQARAAGTATGPLPAAIDVHEVIRAGRLGPCGRQRPREGATLVEAGDGDRCRR